MADGLGYTPGAGSTVATDDAGAAGHVQVVKLAISTDGSATAIPADAANGIDVDVTRLPALVAGTANIGDVDVLTVPTDPFGANADSASATGSISAKLRFIAATGIPVTALPSLPAGTNNIGDVDVLSLPALPAGSNNIGDVDVIGGGVASGSTDSGNPVKVGGRVETTFITAEADGDRVDFIADAYGRQRVVSSTDDIKRLGVYYYSSSVGTILAAAHTGTQGFFWLINPVGSSVKVRVKRIEFKCQHGTVLATPTSPRVALQAMTFTGTFSGSELAAAKRSSSDAAPAGKLCTTITGLTPSAGNGIWAWLPVVALTAVGVTEPAADLWEQDGEDYYELAAGEGIRVWQPDAGTSADTRRFILNIITEEY